MTGLSDGGGLRGRQHADVAHDLQYAAEACPDAQFVETQGLASLVNEQRETSLRRIRTQRALALRRLEDHRCAERHGHFHGRRILQVGAHLCEVRPAIAPVCRSMP